MTQSATWPATVAAGDGCKFAVVDRSTGHRSSTWRASTAKNVDQIYLMEMETGRDWKVSLHNEPGRDTGKPAWRIAMTSEGAREQGIERQVVDHWVPNEPEDGWIEGVGVLIPFSYLRAASQPLSPSVVQVATVDVCSGYYVRSFLADAGAVPMGFPPGFPVAVIDRCTGGRLYILAEPAVLAERQNEAFEALCEESRRDRSDDLDYATDRFVGVIRSKEQRLLVDLSLA